MGAKATRMRKGSLKRSESSSKKAEQKPGLVLGSESYRHFEKMEKEQRKIINHMLKTPMQPVRLSTTYSPLRYAWR